MNIVSHFLESAHNYPDKVAIVHQSQSITFAELRDKVYKAAFDLKQKEVEKDDNILVVIPYSIELYIHILAIFLIGANVVLVDDIKPKSSVLYAFQKSKAKVIVTLRLISWLKYFVFHYSLWKTIIFLKRKDAYPIQMVDRNADDAALITFTSGTTGQPKAANRTHGFLNIQLSTLIEEMKLKSEDTHITSLPVVLMCNLATGVTSIIPTKYTKLSQWHEVRNKFTPNVLSASPSHFSEMSQILECAKLDRVFIGGASILPHFAHYVATKIDPSKVVLVYGSTEAEPMCTLTLHDYLVSFDQDQMGLKVGRPHHNIKISINEASSFAFHPLKDGEVGEIIVAGPHVLAHYYKDDNAFATNKIVNKNTIWHKTGDSGYMLDGEVFLLGRMKYIWLENGVTCAPITMEKYLSSLCDKVEGTWLHLNGKNILFIQKIKNIDQIITDFPHKIDQTIFIEKLPRDKRHLSRIDYKALKLLFH